MAVKLEVFELPQPPGSGRAIFMEPEEIEEIRMQAYDAGFAAGWEDATAATRDDQGRITAELANNLQQLAFTFQEARSHVLKSVEPALCQLSTQLLPQLARMALAPVVLQTMTPLVEGLADTPVRVVLNPASRPAVENLLMQSAGLPLLIEEEPTLGEGQVYLRLADTETRIDLDAAVQDIIGAVSDFFELVEKDAKNG